MANLIGGAVTEIGDERVNTFTSSGTLTVLDGGLVHILAVGGGGGGGIRGQDRGERRRCGDAEHRDRSRHRSSAHPRPRSSEIHLDRVHHRPAPLLAPGRRYITTFIQQSGDRAHQEADLWTR